MDRRAKQTYTLQLHPGIAQLAEAMQRKLDRDHHKGPWHSTSAYRLMNLLMVECTELRNAKPGEALDEAADVANFAMMVAQVIDGTS